MLFNSIEFALFLIVVFTLYWFVFHKSLKIQNLLLLASSYFFYAWWDWRFLGLILFSSLVDFLIGEKIPETDSKNVKKLLLGISLTANLGLLFFFKYYNFFIQSFVDSFTLFGSQLDSVTLNIILPVGISFYTFQTMSYTIDIYREKIEPSRDVIGFLTFVSFFPQLVAGPIERASHLLPQFFKERKFDYDFAVSGIRIIIWGLFKKMVIADNASVIVDGIFQDYNNQTSGVLVLGVIFFAFQIYGDFSGYSDIAIGTSRLFGFDLMTNFKFPYLSKNISEFWKRWHISLSSWFRDYLYIPLGGSRKGKWRSLIHVIIVFTVSGVWHGANWTFLIWGFIHGFLYLPVFINKKGKDKEFTIISLRNIIPILLTFGMTCLAWVYFRSNSVYDANQYLVHMFTAVGTENLIFSTSKHLLVTGIVLFGILLLMAVEVRFSKMKKSEVTLNNKMLIGISLIILFMAAFKNPISFIYFQF